MKNRKMINAFFLTVVITFQFALSSCNESTETFISPIETEERNASDGITFNGRMLVFEDSKTFAETYEYLSKTDGIQQGDIVHQTMIDFEKQYRGYESLRSYVMSQIYELSDRKQLTLENNPDLKYFADNYLRTLVNKESEVMIGDTIIKITPEFLGEEGNTDERGNCCWMFRQENSIVNSGNRLMLCQTWVYNIPLPFLWFGVVGSRSISLEANNGFLNIANVSRIIAGAGYSWVWLFCANSNINNNGLGDTRFNTWLAERTNFHYTFLSPFFVRSQISNHQAVYYNGAELYGQMDLCD